jgi:tetratricopeptide (TPR) repeat protein
MYILQLYSGQNISTGDYVYRIQQPANGLSELADINVVNVDLLELNDFALLTEVPLLILHHVADPDLLPIVTQRQKNGLTTVYELSDHFLVSQNHKPEARLRGPLDYHVVMAELIRRCDAVQTTGPALRERYKHLNANYFIFPNLVDEVCGDHRKADSEKITIGWGGSTRHAADMEHYAEPLIRWIREHPEVRFAIMASKRIRGLFRSLPPRQLLLRSPGSLKEYQFFLDQVDIGIAPLLPTEFNACRSDVKYLEYASREVLPVCSRFGPYLNLGKEGENILLFDNPTELIHHLELLLKNPHLRKKIARQARQWVEKNRLGHRQHWQARAEIYRKLIKKEPDMNKPLFEHTSKNQETKVRNLLVQGIEASKPSESLVMLRKAVELNPDNYQVHYFYGWALCKVGQHQEAVQELQRALALCPNSIRTAQLLTRVLLLTQDFDSALTVVEKALEFEPNLPSLLTLKAIVLQLKNNHKEAFKILESCIGQEPSLVEAELAYARSAIALSHFNKAEETAKRLRQVIPDSAEISVIFASIFFVRGDFKKAQSYLNEALKLDPQHHASRKLLETIKSNTHVQEQKL